jgi:hypothetical protein
VFVVLGGDSLSTLGLRHTDAHFGLGNPVSFGGYLYSLCQRNYRKVFLMTEALSAEHA